LVKSIFESLETIAKDVVTNRQETATAMDDKEQLNIHILTIGITLYII